MENINSYVYILAACILVMLSYLFNLLSRRSGIPSVLLLLSTGIGLRELLRYYQFDFTVSPTAVELFGILGLIMIVLEAGLDLKVGKDRVLLIRNAFFSALVIFVMSAAACASFLLYYLKEPLLNCLIYSIPLGIVSSAIVIPSISHLDQYKQEFLIYETSFSDIFGILFFNYLVAGNPLETGNISFFFGSILLSVVLSIALSVMLLWLLTRIRTRVKFFLVFSVLIFLYAGGKMLHQPSLLIILLFGLIVSNWHLVPLERLSSKIPVEKVAEVSGLLHSLTAESSFLIRTFFFFIFGLTIDLRLVLDREVWLTGSVIVGLLLVIRFVYLRFFLRSHILPELFFMPRGLITILLFYSIPAQFQLSKFNQGILFFIVLLTSIIMMIGSISYGRPKLQAINDEEPELQA
jgi:Kef-type K+ transport system membrane component KefB